MYPFSLTSLLLPISCLLSYAVLESVTHSAGEGTCPALNPHMLFEGVSKIRNAIPVSWRKALGTSLGSTENT